MTKMKSLRLLAAISVVGGASSIASGQDLVPGVCWQYTVPQSISSDRITGPEKDYCLQLRTGVVQYLRMGKPHGALEYFARAYEEAKKLPTDGDMRGRALDEARAAYALVLEATGQVAEALALIQKPKEASRDFISLARAAMLARQLPPEQSQLALDAFTTAKTVLDKKYWTADVEAAFVALQEGQPLPETITRGYLPSYLSDGEYMDSLGALPAPRTFHAAFEIGSAAPGSAALASIREMAVYIETMHPQWGTNPNYQWVLIGHADEACKEGRRPQCHSDNLDLSRQRAEQAQRALNRELDKRGIKDLPITIEYHGMERPLEPKGLGRAWPANRRVQLVLRNKTVVEATSSCPWQVTLYPANSADELGHGGQHVASGVAVAPETITKAGRGSGFTISFVPDRAPAWAKHFYAFSEDAAGKIVDLAALAGREPDVSGLRQQPLLPAQNVYRIDTPTKQEKITLYVAGEPVQRLEDLRSRTTPVASARSGPIQLASAAATTIDGDNTRLADLGISKEWNPAFAHELGSSSPGIFRNREPVPPPPPPVEEPLVVACSFPLDL